MSFGQGGPESRWDPWKPETQQPWGGDGGRTPDWAALAEASETRQKRRRVLFVAGGALATVGVAVAVALAVVSADGDDTATGDPTGLPSAADLPSAGATAPSFAPTSAPPPLNPKDFVASASKDKAPLDTDSLFPGTQLTVDDVVYRKGPTADTRTCSSAARNDLPAILDANDCARLIRITYSADDVAVTVGVAVFDSAAQATKTKSEVDGKSIVRSLSGGGVADFCNGAVCRSTANSYGRYAYFTLAGFTDGTDVTEKDTEVFRAGDDLAEFTFRQILQRGQAQASAAAEAD
ncbi:hypothetical protein AAH978_08485 [Streptomyces sp. ZYX-F-203]